MVALARHAESRGGAVQGIEVGARRDGPLLRISYAVRGSVDALLIPPPRAPRFADGLWRHTCCEIFVARPGSPAYHEFNFSPSGEWAAYAFSSYRARTPFVGGPADPMIRLQREAGAWRLGAAIACGPGTLCLGLSAIVEEIDGSVSYWALAHAPGKPDFHHRDGFALELA